MWKAVAILGGVTYSIGAANTLYVLSGAMTLAPYAPYIACGWGAWCIATCVTRTSPKIIGNSSVEREDDKHGCEKQ